MKCPNCDRSLSVGEQIWTCDECGCDCCTACSADGIGDGRDVVCDDCATDEEFYDDDAVLAGGGEGTK